MISDKEIKDLTNLYKEKVEAQLKLNESIEETLWPKRQSHSFAYWTEIPNDFQTMNRGVTLFVLKILFDINRDLNITKNIINEFKISLNDSLQSYDQGVSSWGSLSEYEEMMFGRDRVNITRKINSLDEFAARINDDKVLMNLETIIKRFEDKKIFYYRDYKEHNSYLNNLIKLLNDLEM